MRSLVRGCRDIFGRAASHRRQLLNDFAAMCSVYNFHEIETPILERVDLYSRTLGMTSDIMSSEMYHLAETDPPLALRPEGTAGVARALRDVGLLKCPPPYGIRVWYAGPMFRHERPQHGRFRQFGQLGVECVGETSLTSDLDTITLASRYLHSIKCDAKLRINTLGNKDTRDNYNTALTQYLKPRYWAMSSTSRLRFDAGNCMRILDSKLAEDVSALSGSPSLAEFVNESEKERFQELCELLDEAQVPFKIDQRLVRGLDYYSSTTFEFDGVIGKAVCAGGRYKNLFGADGIGFAIGLDRIESVKCTGTASYEQQLEGGAVVIGFSSSAERSDCQVGKRTRQLVMEFRERGINCIGRLDGGRLSKQVGRAARAGANVLVVVGEREVASGAAQVKFISQDGFEDPVEMDLTKVVDFVCKRSCASSNNLIANENVDNINAFS